MLKDKKIMVGITGSIAAYKSAFLVRQLVKAGAEVQVIMTPSARDFISPLTLSTLSKKPVLVDLFNEESWANHVKLGRWADLMIVAPLSCNTLAKMANGICDNLLMAVYLSANCPVSVAPAMDEDMWKHPSTKNNLDRLRAFGVAIIPVESGELASGLVGEGRMAEPESIVNFIEKKLAVTRDMTGKRALVSAGPTYEAIDPVRFIGNHSTGKMGVALARELVNRGASVTLVLGPVSGQFDLSGMNVISVKSAAEMYDACMSNFKNADIALMAAAVADYTPAEKATDKIKKKEDEWSLKFVKTKDILNSLGQIKGENQVLVGFALETSNEKENAIQKLKSKNADLIVLNSLNDSGAGFGYDTNKVTIFDRNGVEYPFGIRNKKEVARDIVDHINKLIHAEN